MSIGEELEKLGLELHHREYHNNSSDPDDYEPIDFTITDHGDKVAEVWGSNPTNDVQIECTHPEECMEWGDDDEQGVCKLCGATCTWHYEADEGNVEDFYWKNNVCVPDEWTYPKHIGGIVGEHLAGLAKRW